MSSILFMLMMDQQIHKEKNMLLLDADDWKIINGAVLGESVCIGGYTALGALGGFIFGAV